MIDYKEIVPKMPQRQDSLSDQLSDLYFVANRLGMYDAADAVKQVYNVKDSVKYGCYADVDEDGPLPDCVMDKGNYSECIYAEEGKRKEHCKEWRIIK